MQESRNKTDGKFVLKFYRLNIPCFRQDFQYADDSKKNFIPSSQINEIMVPPNVISFAYNFRLMSLERTFS